MIINLRAEVHKQLIVSNHCLKAMVYEWSLNRASALKNFNLMSFKPKYLKIFNIV
jgi:hypothetical protein